MPKIKTLIEKAKFGDKEAFIELIDTYRKMLFNTSILILKNEEDALDAIQDTILACWEKLPLLNNDFYFKTWLTKILLNKCYDILRVSKHYYFVEETPECLSESDLDTPIDISGTMQKLPVDDQLILSMFYFDDFSVKDISSLLSISTGAVKTRLSRSRCRFKKVYLMEEGTAYEK